MQNSYYSQSHRIRNLMRLKRLSLSDTQQQQAALQIVPQAQQLVTHYQANNIALYLPFNGEISPLALLEHLRLQGKNIYLPVLHPFAFRQLLFLKFEEQSRLQRNRFGILQPRLDIRNIIPPNELEMIFVPLVACDKKGNRLGVGGGYYDRTLAQMPNVTRVGLAHHFQQVESLPVESWDIPLHHLILGGDK
ncbi:5-formyltetrahydrofolate cyclo-ligase [Vespertiliibacter pulmonis]|nr:5-formyltetrahydrofolate cyclo-ligase [Vespertiliibacter pulmonis]QLB20915.1 5-formyltetrahydrofolate cyclo-ligase [Vespertiliibacter pulmonis]